eukprot:s2223_g4.t1
MNEQLKQQQVPPVTAMETETATETEEQMPPGGPVPAEEQMPPRAVPAEEQPVAMEVRHGEACFVSYILQCQCIGNDCQSAKCCPLSHCKASSGTSSGPATSAPTSGIRQTFSHRSSDPVGFDQPSGVLVEFGEDQKVEWPARVAVMVVSVGSELDMEKCIPGAIHSPLYRLDKEMPIWSLV